MVKKQRSQPAGSQVRTPRSRAANAADLNRYLDEHPEIDDGAKRGLEDLQAGRYRMVRHSESKNTS